MTQITWKLIDTAPKSWGKFILLFGSLFSLHKDTELGSSGSSGRNDAIYVGCWSLAHDQWIVPEMMPTLNRVRNDWVEIKPTHWTELPDAPN